MNKRMRLISSIVLVVVIVAGVALSNTVKNSTVSRFVMPSPFPTFDLYKATIVPIILPPLVPVSTQLSTKEKSDVGVSEQLVPNWILGVLATPLPNATRSPNALPQMLDECGDASVLYLKDAGADTGLQGEKIILYFSYDSQAYEFNVTDAEWVIDGDRQPVDLTDEDQKRALSYGQVEYVCYYSLPQKVTRLFADKVFSVQLELSGPVLLFPSHNLR